MEDAVPERIEFEVFDGVHRVPAAQHVMPAQDLMEDNAIEKSSQAQPKENACRYREMPIRGIHDDILQLDRREGGSGLVLSAGDLIEVALQRH